MGANFCVFSNCSFYTNTLSYCVNPNWLTTRVHLELHEISNGAAHCVPLIFFNSIPV